MKISFAKSSFALGSCLIYVVLYCTKVNSVLLVATEQKDSQVAYEYLLLYWVLLVGHIRPTALLVWLMQGCTFQGA